MAKLVQKYYIFVCFTLFPLIIFQLINGNPLQKWILSDHYGKSSTSKKEREFIKMKSLCLCNENPF